jgi:hypothetical protein
MKSRTSKAVQTAADDQYIDVKITANLADPDIMGITEISGKIFVEKPESESVATFIGNIDAYILNFPAMLKEPIFECDAISGDLEGMYSSLFDLDSGGYNGPGRNKRVAKLFYISSLEITPEFPQAQVAGITAMQSIIDNFGHLCDKIVIAQEVWEQIANDTTSLMFTKIETTEYYELGVKSEVSPVRYLFG